MRTYTLLKANTEWLDLENAEDRRVHLDVIAHGRISKAIEMGLFEAVALIEAKNAEDAFDLDNNPMRGEERELLVVDFVVRQPMNVGDVLIDNKNGIYQICKPRDWAIISSFNYAMPQIAGRQKAVARSRNVEGSVEMDNFA